MFDGFQPLTNVAKSSILNVWQGSECASILHIFLTDFAGFFQKKDQKWSR